MIRPLGLPNTRINFPFPEKIRLDTGMTIFRFRPNIDEEYFALIPTVREINEGKYHENNLTSHSEITPIFGFLLS